MNDPSSAQTGSTPIPATGNPASNTSSTMFTTEFEKEFVKSYDDGTSVLKEEKLANFKIADHIKSKYPGLINLILETESMKDEERQYWFQIMPIMNEDQITRYKNILLNEKIQLKKIDEEYEEELKQLKQKHLLEWQEFEAREARKKRLQQEQATEHEEQQKQEELLQDW